MQKKIWYYEKWGGRHASFPPRPSVKKIEQSAEKIQEVHEKEKPESTPEDQEIIKPNSTYEVRVCQKIHNKITFTMSILSRFF